MADEMSPVELLRAAAVKARKIGSLATPGPWRTHDTYLNVGGYTATVLSGPPGQGDLRAWLPTRSNEPWIEERNAWNDSAWIALVHPGLAEPLAVWLDAEADEMEKGIGTTWPMGSSLSDAMRDDMAEFYHGRALRVARVLLGVPDGR